MTARKFILVGIISMSLLCSSNSNAQAFEKNNAYVSFGYGGPNFTKNFFKIFQTRANYRLDGLGPIHGKFEYAVSDKIGFGVSINYVNTKVIWNAQGIKNNTAIYENGFDFKAIASNARINWHLVEDDNLDAYFGLGMGYNYIQNGFYSEDPDYEINEQETFGGGIIGFEITFGARYLITENIGIYAEFGWAKSLVQGGIVLKF